MDDEVTLEDIKNAAMHDTVGSLMMVLEGTPPVRHLALAAQLAQHGRDVNAMAKRLRAMSDVPEHQEMADAMRTAAHAAQLAFDAAANAVYQLVWAMQHCDCEECVQDRRRDKAESN